MAQPACRLVVDCREHAVIQALGELVDEGAGEWSARGLDVGDALVETTEGRPPQTEGGPPGAPTPLMVVERKTLADLCASVKDGRYREQKARLLEYARVTGAAAVYVLEGYGGFGLGGGGLRSAATRGGLHEAALQTCVWRMLFADGIRVLCTRDARDSAECLRALRARAHKLPAQSAGDGPSEAQSAAAAACVREQGSAMLIHAKRGRNITPPLCFRMQLCQIPGVSEKIAGGVAERWGTMASFYEHMGPLPRADRVKALVGVPLVGKKNAHRIEEFMFVVPTE